MKTEYQILWIDDDHRSVNGDKRTIKSFLDDYGIELVINDIKVTADSCPTESEEFSKSVADINLDMVFIDYNMPEQGDLIISHIRKSLKHYHLPILFYTGDDQPETVLTSIFESSIEKEQNFLDISDGIYFCDRDYIKDKAIRILTSLLEKEKHPQRVRGLLMDRVSEIDANIMQSFSKHWPNVPEDKQAEIQGKIKAKLITRQKKSVRYASEIDEIPYDDLAAYMSDKGNRALDTHFRAEILREVLRSIEDMKPLGNTLSEFYNSNPGAGRPHCLVSLRNIYAHQTADDIEAEHDDKKCKYIRTETRRHLLNSRKLLGKS